MDLKIGRAWGESEWTPTAGLKAWPEIEQSDFYRWFGWHEIGRTDLGDGRVLVQLKPGGHQESIDLAVALDAQQSVRLASLTLHRFWVDGGQTAKLADDMAQSFLLAFAQRHPEGPALAEAIFAQVRGSQPILRAGDPTAGPPPPPSMVVENGLMVYRDGQQAVEIKGPDVTIVLDNWRDMDTTSPGHLLMIEVLAAVPPPHPFGHKGPVLITAYPGYLDQEVVVPPQAPPPYQPPVPVLPVEPPVVPPPPLPAAVPVAPPPGRSYDDLYLQASDLPAGLTRGQDSRGSGADPGDVAYEQHGGIDSGMTVWNGPRDAAIHRLVDIRWVFPTPQAATAYHHQTMFANAEMMPEVQGAPRVGTDCRVFGGLFEPLGPGTGITSYFYLFTVGNVVVKLYAADFDGKSLRLDLVTPIAQSIVRRISAAQGGSAALAKKPWWRFW